MQMYVDRQWVESEKTIPVISPYTQKQIETIPEASPDQIERALVAAQRGAAAMAKLTAYERAKILTAAADRIDQLVEDFAQTISLEEGKPISEARAEASRTPDLLRLCAFEGTQARGETLPLDAAPGTRNKFGFTMRVPCGIVLAITPFNYPLLLVAHKVGPALAAGNAVILKPAESTSLTALKFTRILLDAGLPEDGLQCITGSGPKIGPVLCSDPRVRSITFTGSTHVGDSIARVAGVKRLALELGSNAALVILPDADLKQVAEAAILGGYANAGQVCISAQRILAHKSIYRDFLDALKPRVESIKIGEPLAGDTKLSAMISDRAAERVDSWIKESLQGGARVVTGGTRERAVYAPTIIADVKPEMRIFRDELFGPAVCVTEVESIDHAIALANDTRYGLCAGIFTRDLNNAMRFAREVESGLVQINWTPLWRADFIPYGGLKGSGIGKEGPRYAIEQVTETKTVVFHGLDN
ncbi:MAG: aldehyde dehydrogenase family protein [Candidatus Acidiferrales bacterium]|jgi:acyl-CoA reductase-like NAD-dependent aldehyde dehydrogenase